MTKRKPVVPTFEPEVVKAIADRVYRGDTEKVATTALDEFAAYGVGFSSRYSKAGEYKLMARMVEAVPAQLRRFIESIYYDSKSLHMTIMLKTADEEDAHEIAELMAEACRRIRGGHDGMTFHGDKISIEKDAEWYWGDE